MLSGPRYFADLPLAAQATAGPFALPDAAARHIQVRRMQPGDALVLFDGLGGEWDARVARMGRSDVSVELLAHCPVEREAPRAIHLAVGMPANERMDWLVEKATELGAASIQPLATARGVLRVAGERADKKLQHWRGIAAAACAQCGRNRLPVLHPVVPLESWLQALPPQDPGTGPPRWLLALAAGAVPLPAGGTAASALLLSGPEGGLAPAEEALALDAGFAPATLGARVLRAETAPLAALARLAG